MWSYRPYRGPKRGPRNFAGTAPGHSNPRPPHTGLYHRSALLAAAGRRVLHYCSGPGSRVCQAYPAVVTAAAIVPLPRLHPERPSLSCRRLWHGCGCRPPVRRCPPHGHQKPNSEVCSSTQKRRRKTMPEFRTGCSFFYLFLWFEGRSATWPLVFSGNRRPSRGLLRKAPFITSQVGLSGHLVS